MARQLVLLDQGRPDWRFDDATRTVGKRGIAAARAALGHVAGTRDDDTHRPAA